MTHRREKTQQIRYARRNRGQRSGAWFTVILSVVLWPSHDASSSDRSGWAFYRQAVAYSEPDIEMPMAELEAREFTSFLWGAATILQHQKAICLPESPPPESLWLPVVEALRDRPELRSQTRAAIVPSLLRELYPCQEKTQDSSEVVGAKRKQGSS